MSCAAKFLCIGKRNGEKSPQLRRCLAQLIQLTASTACILYWSAMEAVSLLWRSYVLPRPGWFLGPVRSASSTRSTAERQHQEKKSLIAVLSKLQWTTCQCCNKSQTQKLEAEAGLHIVHRSLVSRNLRTLIQCSLFQKVFSCGQRWQSRSTHQF